MSYSKSKDELREEFPRQVHKRKNTKQWCKGKVGVEHVTETVLNHNRSPSSVCGWVELMRWYAGERGHWRWHYHCRHAIQCVNCGKYLKDFLGYEEFPDAAANPKPEVP
jgi:hypothetical protein